MNGLDTPLAFKASSDPDTLTFDKAMADPDRPLWIESAHKEIKLLEENHTWEEVDVAEAKTKILPGTWVFRRKRTPDRVISKVTVTVYEVTYKKESLKRTTLPWSDSAQSACF
jgi:hypothetical protein